MKIAFLSEKYTPDIGGLAISAERLARSLASTGHEVRVFAPTASLSPSEQRTLLSDGVRLTRFGAHRRLGDTLVDWFELIVREHGREPFEGFQAYFLPGAGFAAVYAARYLGLPGIVGARGNDLERALFDPGSAAQILYTLQHASAVTANTHELAHKARALVEGLRVDVIPNGVNTEHFRPVPRNNALAASLNLMSAATSNGRARVIGFAGELREKKGLRPLLSAYAQVNKKSPATLLIVGDVRPGEDKEIVEDFRRSHPAAQVIVSGFVPPSELPAYYALMDVFVQPSLRDGLPNALLEAMACGRAVIGTRTGGIVDAVQNGKNGRLVSTSDADALAAAIDELLSDERLRQRFGEAGRQTTLENFTLRAELEGYLHVYRRLGLRA